MPTSDFTYLEDKVISIIIQHNIQHDEPGDVQQRRGHVAGAPAGQTQHHHRARQDGGGEGKSINETISEGLMLSCDLTYFLHFRWSRTKFA